MDTSHAFLWSKIGPVESRKYICEETKFREPDDHHINSVVEIVVAKDQNILYALLEGKKGALPANYGDLTTVQTGSDSSRKRTLRSQ
mgnify:CR=1 FL=1